MTTPACPCCGQQLPERPNAVQTIAAEYQGLPIAEILRRGWLGDETTVRDSDDLRARLWRFMDTESDADFRASLNMGPA